MRKELTVGILREAKKTEYRVALVPSDVQLLVDRGISVEVEENPHRAFSDRDYRKSGAVIVERARQSKVLVGIKEPLVRDLLPNSVYLVFSHTGKGQARNMPLLRACLTKRITLVDYENIVDFHGGRTVFFGRYAGICGIVDSLHHLGRKLRSRGVDNPFLSLYPAHKYRSLEKLKESMKEVRRRIRLEGFQAELAPFIVGITGHGNVSKGVQEILDLCKPVEIHPRDMHAFISHQKTQRNRLYKIVFHREEKFRSRDGHAFYFEEYLEKPEKFVSNLDQYLPFLNLLIHTSYWDSRYPRLVTKEMIRTLSKKEPFRLDFIGDISCDIRGAIELTRRATTRDNPTYTYNPGKDVYVDGGDSEGVTVLAVDNLPAEMPVESSIDFSGRIRDYVYQVAAHGITDITRHMAIPSEIRNAVVTENGELTGRFHYLREFLAPK